MTWPTQASTRNESGSAHKGPSRAQNVDGIFALPYVIKPAELLRSTIASN